MMTVKMNRSTVPLTLLAPIAWGTTYLTITQLLPAGRPLFVAAARVVPAGLLLIAIGAVHARWRPRGREWGRHFLVGLCNFGLFFPLLTVAVYRLPGGVAAAAGGLSPLLVALLSWQLVRRRPSRAEVVVGIVAALGVGMVVVRPGAHLDTLGVLAAIGSNVTFSLATVLTKRFPSPPHRLAATGWQLLLGGAVLVPLALGMEGAPPPWTGSSLLGFAWLSLGCTGVAFVVWYDGVRRLPTVAPPLLGLAAPVTGATLGWIVLGQSLSMVQLVGFALTIGAIAFGALSGSGRSAAHDGGEAVEDVGEPRRQRAAAGADDVRLAEVEEDVASVQFTDDGLRVRVLDRHVVAAPRRVARGGGLQPELVAEVDGEARQCAALGVDG
ncbi:MAG: hypothetical protein RJA49_2997 [Actinomycetota bacterium]